MINAIAIGRHLGAHKFIAMSPTLNRRTSTKKGSFENFSKQPKQGQPGCRDEPRRPVDFQPARTRARATQQKSAPDSQVQQTRTKTIKNKAYPGNSPEMHPPGCPRRDQEVGRRTGRRIRRANGRGRSQNKQSRSDGPPTEKGRSSPS